MENLGVYIYLGFVFICLVASAYAKTDIKAIRHLLWAILFMLASIADILLRIVNQ